MHNYKKFMSLTAASLLSIEALPMNDILLVGKPQTITIVNDAEQALHVTHNIPEYTLASVELKRLPEPQKMLYDAIANNSTKDILQAVKFGANVNSDIDGKLPILIAMSLKKFNSVAVLKKCGAIVPVLKTMMHRAILNNSPEEIRYALNSGADINLGVATTFAQYNAIKTLLECGAQASFDQVEKSMMMGDIKSALLLLNHMPVDVNTARELRHWKKDNKNICEYVVAETGAMSTKGIAIEFMRAVINHGSDISLTRNQSHQKDEWTENARAWISHLSSMSISTFTPEPKR